jgi:hypothetical protein
VFLRTLCIAILACVSVAAFADSPSDIVTIPLKDIWALDMPGTKDVKELEPEKFGEQTQNLPLDKKRQLLDESNLLAIRQSLGLQLDGSKDPPSSRPGFAVSGSGITALQNAVPIFTKKVVPQKSFTGNSEITLVFISNQMGSFVHLGSVERKGNIIEVRYHFVTHLTQMMSEHFALIPLGKLPVGDYHVEIIQTPTNYKEWEEKNVSKPFSFSVVKVAD